MREYKNSMLVTWIGIAISVAVIVLNFWDVFPRHERWWVTLLIVIASLIYLGFIGINGMVTSLLNGIDVP